MKLKDIEDSFSKHRLSEDMLYTGIDGYHALSDFLERSKRVYINNIRKSFDTPIEEYSWDIFPKWNYKNIKII